VSSTFHNEELAEFLDLNVDSFFENKVSNPGGKKIPEGMKLIKAFKFFESNKQALRDMQDIASQLVQENKINGTLCFSVHPLDFLSSSENTYNWRSCHALDGEYRAGNLSYMVDTTTFMVYLKGADDVHLPAFGDVKWNSKKWRMLIHAAEDDDIIFAGRQYPFTSTNGLDQVLKIYNNIYYEDPNRQTYHYKKYLNWCNNYVDCCPCGKDELTYSIELEDRYFVYGNRLIGMTEAVKPGYGARNYNDLLLSSCYTKPWYAVLDTWGYHSPHRLREHPLIIGDEVTCLHCGQEAITDSETMRCNCCEMDYGYEENETYGCCSCCGARIYLDDASYVGDYDEPVCDSCYDKECFICEECGETHFNSVKHYIRYSEAEDNDAYVCQHCYESYLERRD
jgi:hypothetical protein